MKDLASVQLLRRTKRLKIINVASRERVSLGRFNYPEMYEWLKTRIPPKT